jgi:SAM-dependent methyltransferase
VVLKKWEEGVTVTNYIDMNRLNWNERTAIHAKSDFYNIDDFLAEKSSLSDKTELGDVAGLSMLHLQCHFGKDSLSWARMGAHVLGVDFSEDAIALAKSLNERLGLDARFLCSDIYNVAKELQGEQFDIVYTSYGVLCWLQDLTRWAELISTSLKPGGTFYMAELHPLTFMYEVEDNQLKSKYPYFDNKVRRYESSTTYTGDNDKLEHSVTYQWQHTLGEIVSALAGSGLKLEFLHEFPFTVYNMFPGLMFQDELGWRMKENEHLPLLFSVKATKH